jgi:hypothetical protein
MKPLATGVLADTDQLSWALAAEICLLACCPVSQFGLFLAHVAASLLQQRATARAEGLCPCNLALPRGPRGPKKAAQSSARFDMGKSLGWLQGLPYAVDGSTRELPLQPDTVSTERQTGG